MTPTVTEFGSSNESLRDTPGCATTFLQKVATRCKAVPQKVRSFAKKTKAFAKRAHVKRARECQNEERVATNPPHSKKVVEVAEASINMHPTVEEPGNAVHHVLDACVNVQPTTQPHESMLEQVAEEDNVAENAMEVRGSMDVETPVSPQESCEEGITRNPSPQTSTGAGGDLDTATTLGEHGHLSREESDELYDRSGTKTEMLTTSYHEVAGIEEDFTVEDVEEILDYMPKVRTGPLWIKNDIPVSFEEVYGQWGDRYFREMNTEAKAQDFGACPGKSGISEHRESYSAYERSSSIEGNVSDVATEGSVVKEKPSEEGQVTEHLEISFFGESDVDNNSAVLLSDSLRVQSREENPLVQNEISVLRVQSDDESYATENEEISDTFWRGMRLVVVALGSGLLLGRWFYVYELRIFY